MLHPYAGYIIFSLSRAARFPREARPPTDVFKMCGKGLHVRRTSFKHAFVTIVVRGLTQPTLYVAPVLHALPALPPLLTLPTLPTLPTFPTPHTLRALHALPMLHAPHK